MRNLHLLSIICVFISMTALSFAGNSIPIQARKLIKQRDLLQQELLRADQKAADAVLIGEDPLELHASQTGLQEQVDVLQMRLESLALRFDFSLPDLADSIRSNQAEDLLGPHIAIGRERTDETIRDRCRSDCRDMLLQIRFDDFLDF